MQEPLPIHLRAITFAANELALELITLLQGYSKKDLESALILLTVTDATMRPFMLNDVVAQDVLTAERPPDTIRGAISRRMIAEETGLSRETVRRKTRELAKAGLVIVDRDDRVRSAQRLGEADFQRVVEDGHRAVLRYLQRLQSCGVPLDCLGS